MPETPPSPPAHGSPAGSPPPALIEAVRRVLAPLVRLLLSHQITFPALSNLLKSAYVEEANAAFSIPGRPQTISRISLLTGIHRKDVKRLQSESAEEISAPPNVSLGAQLVLRWTAEPEYHDSKGRPRDLPRLAGDRTQPSFEGLVESVTNDIRPRAILDEWLRLGIVEIDDEDRVHLAQDAFVPSHGFDEKAYYLGRNLHDHLAAASHNLENKGRPLLERSVYYARLHPESVTELQDLATEAGMEALQKINQRARQLQRADASRPESSERMTFGVYFFRAPVETSADEPDAGTKQGEGDDR